MARSIHPDSLTRNKRLCFPCHGKTRSFAQNVKRYRTMWWPSHKISRHRSESRRPHLRTVRPGLRHADLRSRPRARRLRAPGHRPRGLHLRLSPGGRRRGLLLRPARPRGVTRYPCIDAICSALNPSNSPRIRSLSAPGAAVPRQILPGVFENRGTTPVPFSRPTCSSSHSMCTPRDW